MDASEGTGTTVLLARKPGRAAAPVDAGPARRFWLAHTTPGGVRMRSGVVDDVRDLLELDLRATARGELPPLGRKTTEPLLLVCANAKRDACCALLGRPLAAELAADPALADVVWESSHLGGHRFAPTSLLLPWGTSYGRVDHSGISAALEEARAGRASLMGYRGRTALRRWLQAAEIAVREAEGVDGIDDLSVLRVTPSGMVVPAPVGTPKAAAPEPAEAEVRHADGRAWRVTVTRSVIPPRPESCGGELVAGESYATSWPVALPPWRTTP